MKKAWAKCNTMTSFAIRDARIALKQFLGKKFKNTDWWSTDVTLVSIAVNSALACNMWSERP